MSTSKDARADWAWTQIEAMADDSLTGEERVRMEAALASDPDLRAAVDRAHRLGAELRRLPRPRPPRGLLGRLLAVPGRSESAWPMLAAPLGAMAVAALAALLVASVRQAPPDPSPEAEAVREFVLAMTYLQRSAVVTRDEVGGQVGQSLASVLMASRESLAEIDWSRE